MMNSRNALYAAVFITLFWVVLRGIMDPLLCYDPWYYHLPFAAVLWNINDARSYFGDIIVAPGRFQGFGLAANWLQGLFWWIFGSANFVPLVNSLPYLAMLVLAWKWFGVPVAFMAFATLAMPLISIHITSGYIDVFIGVMQMLVVLAGLRLGGLYEHHGSRRDKLIACAVLAFGALMAGNAKHSAYGPLLGIIALCFIKIHKRSRYLVNLPLTAATLALLWGICTAFNASTQMTLYVVLGYICLHLLVLLLSLLLPGTKHRGVLLFLVLVAIGSAGTFIKNAYYYQNPFHPLQNPYYQAGLTFGQSEEQWKQDEPSHVVYYTLKSGMIQFLLSVTDIEPFLNKQPRPFIYTEASHYGGSMRSGGLFGPLIVGLLLFMVVASVRLARRKALPDEIRDAIHYFLVLTAVYLVMIQSYQLRYDLVWAFLLCMICGMLLNELCMRGSQRWVNVQWAFAAFFVACQLFLPLQRSLFSTHVESYYPPAIKKKLDPRALEQFRKYGKACFTRTPAPYPYEAVGECPSSFLIYSPLFTGMPMRIQWTTDPDECDMLEGKSPTE